MKRKIIIGVLLGMALLVGAAYADTMRLGSPLINAFSFNPTAITTVTASTYTVKSADSLVNANATSNAITITLPTVASARLNGTKDYCVVKTDSGANAVTIAAASGDTIGGEVQRVLLRQNDYIVLTTGGTLHNWSVTWESPYMVENHEAGTTSAAITGSQSITGNLAATGTLTVGGASATTGIVNTGTISSTGAVSANVTGNVTGNVINGGKTFTAQSTTVGWVLKKQ